MWPLVGGIFSGISSMVGSMFSSSQSKDNSQANIQMQRETNQMAAEEAQKNRAFQEEMSSTAYQRSSQDMQKAGLNPMMMFGSGSAASTPGGGQASFQAPKQDVKSALADMGHNVNNAVNTAISVKTFEKMTDEIALIRANESRTKAEEALTGQREKTEKEETFNRKIEGILRQLQLPKARVSAAEGESVEKMPLWLRDLLQQTSYGSQKGGDTADLIARLLSSARGVKSLRPQRSTSETTDSRGGSTFTERFNY